MVVGAGPNGLAAAITLATAGMSVRVIEANPTAGGGCRSSELTLPGFVHDTCSTIHGLAAASPYLKTLPLQDLGLELVHPDAPLAHPLEGGSAAILERSLGATAAGLGEGGPSYRRLMQPLVARADRVLRETLRPLRVPRDPSTLTPFGVRALWPANLTARVALRGELARALLGGMSAHSMLPLTAPVSGAFGLVLATVAHAYGWPVVRGGSQRLSDALAQHLRSLGGEVEVGREVRALGDLPQSRLVLLDLTPRQVVGLAAGRLPGRYLRALRKFRYGPGVFKLDWALSGAIPWLAPACARAGTVHLGGTLDQISQSEAEVWRGVPPERPFVILVQATRFDPSRAPDGAHTAWAYCHVPSGCEVDMTGRIEAQVERFAPGFRDLILARHAMGPAAMEAHDANYVGGDINGGVQDLRQLIARPVARYDPYSTPDPRLFLCSSSTPPGGGVHGMCGHLAALSALRRLGRGPSPE